MSTYLSIHYVTDVTADHNPGIPSLRFEIHGEGRAPHSVTMFCDDAVLNARLVEAINKVSRERREEKALAQSEDNAVAGDNHSSDEEIVF